MASSAVDSSSTVPTISSRLSLRPLKARELPAHPILAKLQEGEQGKLPTLKEFVLDLLKSADVLVDQSLQSEFKKKGSPKRSPPSAAPVQLFSRELNNATWFARVSTHENEAKEGTASWDEFVTALYEDHSVHEADYTPNIYDYVKVLDWSKDLDGVEDPGEVKGDPGNAVDQEGKPFMKWADAGSNWAAMEDLHVEIYEMAHRIPSPLSNRVFCTLVVRARKAAAEANHREFVVVQVPVDIYGVQEAMYTLALNRKEGSTPEKRKEVVLGQYTSVEKVVMSSSGQTGGQIGVVWSMATASDARGNLPMAIQKMGVPGAIVKDVGFVLKWTADRRRGRSQASKTTMA